MRVVEAAETFGHLVLVQRVDLIDARAILHKHAAHAAAVGLLAVVARLPFGVRLLFVVRDAAEAVVGAAER